MPRLSYSSGFPPILVRKLYKTGQTRGAQRDEIYQNRVSRNSTVLIPYSVWKKGINPPENIFENGYIVIIRPKSYFGENYPNQSPDLAKDIKLGENALIFYRTRNEWEKYNPKEIGWDYAKSRATPLKGKYIARVPDTTSNNRHKIFEGFTDRNKGGVGAGIRVYEYASSHILELTRYQLAYLAWNTTGMKELSKGHSKHDPDTYINHVGEYCEENGLIDKQRLEKNQLMLNGKTICPLCLKEIDADELASRMELAEGRDVPDLTITVANLFHVKELRVGVFNHEPYNLGWGHHYCNTVAADLGIEKTIEWMSEVLKRYSKKELSVS